MKCTTKWINYQREWGSVAHGIAVIGLVCLAVLGVRVEGSGGWITNPPVMLVGRVPGQGQRCCRRAGFALEAGRAYLGRSWPVALARSEAILLLAVVSNQKGWEWVSLLPWGVWLWRGLGASCPWLWRMGWYRGVGRVGDEVSRWALVWLGLMWLRQQRPIGGDMPAVSNVAVGCIGVAPEIEVEQGERGRYRVCLKGEFELHIDGSVMMYVRLLIIFLSLLESPGMTRASRRTRDGRTPVVRQEQMAVWFGVPRPHISRWIKYWLDQDWRRLLSQRFGEVLTLEMRDRIITAWAKRPWMGVEPVWQHLCKQGEKVTKNQIRQAARESGWNVVRAELKQVYQISLESIRPRDEWLVSQLLAQVQELVVRLEEVEGLRPEQSIEISDLKALCAEVGIEPAPARAALPWVLRLERVWFGYWEPVEDGSVRCIYCGSMDVSRKSRKPRLKKYVDETGQAQTVEVYRFYCHNPACQYKSFTNLPPNLIPYSKWTLGRHVAALQSYEWMHSVYRCTGQALGVSKMTAYRWVSAFGYELLPVAALFGLVRSSKVVGVDEKYVLVPKNNKPEGKMKRWMYVYFAVDCYTYDLLHIEIYPYNTSDSATAFLLALRAKGYHPSVIVTDMRVDYDPVIAQVFPKATHHECIFHALQQVREHVKDAYGAKYAETQPEVEALVNQIDHIFDAKTKRTAQRRYDRVLAQRKRFVSQTPEAVAIFDFLERHWPKLVNAIESKLIPTTNNATEEVIRIFTQHYKTFCGFENIQSARTYLAVFEKVYRFTPFSSDAQKRLRGKCPLEVAGYDVKKLPMAQLLRGFALQWPAEAFKELVPCS